LLAALDWAGVSRGRLNPLEVEFLEACEAAEQREAQTVRRSNTRLRLLAAGLAIALAGALIGATAAVRSSRRAANAARLATAQRLAVQATGSGAADLRLLLAVEARRLVESPDTDGALLTALNHVYGVRRFLRSSSPITAAAASPDGKTIVTGDESGTVRVWDAASGAVLRAVEYAHAGAVTATAFSAPGGLVASGGQDGVIRVWHTADLTPARAPLRAHAGPVQAVAFIDGGAALESIGADHLDRVFSVANGTATDTASLDSVDGAVLSPSGTLVVRGADGSAIVRSGAGARTILHLPSRAGVLGVSPDGAEVAVGQPGGSVAILAASNSEQTRTIPPPTLPAPAVVTAVAFDRVGETLAVAYQDTVARFRVADGTILGSPDAISSGTINSVEVGADAADLVATNSTGEVALVHLSASALARNLPVGPLTSIRALAFSPDGSLLAAGGGGGSIAIFDTATSRRRLQLQAAGTTVNALAISPDGSRIAAGDEGGSVLGSVTGTISIWSSGDGRLIVRSGLPDLASVVATSYLDADRLLVTDQSGATWIVDPSGSFHSYRPSGFTGAVLGAAESDDRSVVAAVLQRGTAAVITNRGTSVGSFPAVGATGAVAIDRGGTVLVVATSGAPLIGLRRGRSYVADSATDPIGPVEQAALDGRGRIVALQGGGSVILWDVRAKRRVGSSLPVTAATALAFSPNGSRLAVGSQSGELLVWETDPAAWARAACAVAGRRLSRQEWRTFLPGRAYRPGC
jgi:WD40 repeat protein